jgi:serine protease Do
MTTRRSSHGLSLALLGAGAVLGATCTPTVPSDDQRAEKSPAGKSPGKVLRATFAASPAFAQAAADGSSATLADVAARAVPSVVNLSATRRVDVSEQRKQMLADPLLREFFGRRGGPDVPEGREARSLGSGVIVGDGVVLTSAHVVEKADHVEITLQDGRELDGKVVGADSRSDLAVVRIQGKRTDLKSLPLGDSSAMRQGDVVLAIGNPFGVGQTVTMGIVSATGRSSLGIVDYEDFIQTDAAINPGNSGGALVNMRGELIGINTAILSGSGGSMGIGFAIPSGMAGSIMKSLLKDGRVVRGFLGVAVQDLDRDLARALDLDERSGILVSDVTEGSPAEKAGITRGDVIRSIQGRKLDSSTRFRNEVAALAPGSKASLEVVREGKPRTVQVELGTLKDEARDQEEQPDRKPEPAAPEGQLSGLAVADLSTPLRRRLAVPPRIAGAIVTEVTPAGAADHLGLRPGDVVMELNRQPITSAVDLRRKARAADRERLVILVYREGSTMYLAAHE